jgi:thiol-disulfide isomerase/thioredoxin
MIAPTFESLSTKYSKPNKIAFCKVDVDNQRDVAQQYSVRAMPTFLVLRNGSVIETIQGANPPALTAAVEKAVKLAGPGGGGGATFSGSGQRLGGSGVGPKTVRRPMKWAFKPLLEAVIAFFGLYFWSLLSVSTCSMLDGRVRRGANCSQLDPYKSAENSPFNKVNPPARVQSGTGTKPAARPGFKTLADLGSS